MLSMMSSTNDLTNLAQLEWIKKELTSAGAEATSRANSRNPNDMAVQRCLDQLQEELEKIPNKDAFNRVRLVCPEEADSDDFRLVFLQSDRFNVQIAARRIVMHFRHKLELFGQDLLGKKISLSDLTKEDRDPLKCGGVEMFLANDNRTRSVIVINYNKLKYKEKNSMVSFKFSITD
jgi:hypothetical protein